MARLQLALIGRVRAGNTFAAWRLQKQHKFHRKYLMDGVTKFVRYMYKYQKYERAISWTKKLEIYDALYQIDPNVHINYLLRRIDREDATADVVVEDVRYLNEVKILQERGFKIVRITPSELKRPLIIKAHDKEGKIKPGLVSVHEWFGLSRNPDQYPSDYSIVYDTKLSTWKSIDQLVERLREIDLKVDKALSK